MELIRLEFGVGVRTAGGVLPLGPIFGIGRNYAEHAREQGAAVPDRPMVFMKNPASACLHGDAIIIPRACQDASSGGDQVDYEAELAVVIGRAARDVAPVEALRFVLGYCCANDVSARWWQRHGSGGQFCRGKSFDTFCPVGPRVVPAAEVSDPQRLGIRCRVNGRVMQDDTTATMMFPVAGLIAELSRGTTLAPGTVILTGTPSGVGMAKSPPEYLTHGDVVEVEIEGLGVLCNSVVREAVA